MLVATLAALCAAVLFAMAAALQHRSAGLVSDGAALGTAQLSGFLLRTLRDPLWVLGGVAGVAGFALHALALRDGPLTLVQPLLVSGVVFALPLRHLLEHRAPRRNEIWLAALLAVGLVLFLTIATPAGGTAQLPDAGPTVVSGILIGLGVVGSFVAGRRATGSRAALLLGTGAALAFAAVAGLLKETMGVLSRGPAALATAWPVYALILAGVIGLVLNQLAYQAGPLSSSLPAVATVDPLVSLVIGVAVFDERFRSGPGALVGEALGLALVVAASIGLTGTASRNVRPLGRAKEPLRGARSATSFTNPRATETRLAQRRKDQPPMTVPAPSQAL
ncbi:MAG TPA: DMT family transporter [Acidimicrobiales bacterium]|nr:DMT family transporter [Acidimicrobiales bacterium]